MHHRQQPTALNGILFLLILGISLLARGQTPALRDIDNRLTTAYKDFREARLDFSGNPNDSIEPQFRALMKSTLSNPLTFEHPLDSLCEYMNCRSSADHKVKFYCWDILNGGSYHTIHALAQFRGEDGTVHVQSIDPEEDTIEGDYTDSGIYRVHSIRIRGVKHYLTFAWGTYGSGTQHKIAQIFSLEDNELTKCRSCWEGNQDLVVQYPRWYELDMQYHPRSRTVTFQKYGSLTQKGYADPSGVETVFKLRKGVFECVSGRRNFIESLGTLEPDPDDSSLNQK